MHIGEGPAFSDFLRLSPELPAKLPFHPHCSHCFSSFPRDAEEPASGPANDEVCPDPRLLPNLSVQHGLGGTGLTMEGLHSALINLSQGPPGHPTAPSVPELFTLLSSLPIAPRQHGHGGKRQCVGGVGGREGLTRQNTRCSDGSPNVVAHLSMEESRRAEDVVGLWLHNAQTRSGHPPGLPGAVLRARSHCASYAAMSCPSCLETLFVEFKGYALNQPVRLLIHLLACMDYVPLSTISVHP